ncbi:MAG TPA: Dam family site-specific DNA-(adenine-N6)-methyltransferase [Vicinamibacterales bacterium]|nr:Dam family site-specific DNA-(adenine-N6)-methyltransferase [Vicinamibacterales bacterium]
MTRDHGRRRSVVPPLKWAGGKRWQLPLLEPLWAPHAARRLVEPFCGGLAVALGLGPKRALLNDANPHLINFYRWLKRGLVIDLPMENERAAYYRHRQRLNALIADGRVGRREAAALFYYLNRTGYNGLCRFNQKGAFNVPFGRYHRITYRRDFREFQTVFAAWTFTNRDVLAVPLEADDFVYADPPYDVEFRQYGPLGFHWHDQVRTAEWLASHAGPVVLVNQATPRIADLYRSLGYQVTELDGPRRISCTGDRRPAREVLATRNV